MRTATPALPVILTIPIVLGCAATLVAVHRPGVAGQAGPLVWAAIAMLALGAMIALDGLSHLGSPSPWVRRGIGILLPTLFGGLLVFLWEATVVGAGVPSVLLPAPSAIAARFATSLPTLLADFAQTFLKSVLAGYVLGCCSGFLVAIAVDRVPYLRRGLLPVGSFVSALPVVGIAPIMVMWFGFDWPSKAAVVVAMTFFPMLVNTVAGLEAAGHQERDLLRSYAASDAVALNKLRLPAAMPFIFNALKINSTLALIGAIVAEFFGTPIVGMGFRISIEAARMSLDMVWAEIALAALCGSCFYGFIVLVERSITFWHPSVRAQS